MSDNVYKLPDGSSIVKNSKGKITTHLANKTSGVSNVLAFKSRNNNSSIANEPRISYDEAYQHYTKFLENKKTEASNADGVFIIDDLDSASALPSPFFVNQDLVTKDNRQSKEFESQRDPQGIVRDIDGEPLGILLRYESKKHTDGVTTVGYGDNHLLHVAYLELEPWVSTVDRGRGIEYRLVKQELEKPLLVNPEGVDFLGVRVSVAEANTTFAIELLQDNWSIDSYASGSGFNMFEKLIPKL